MSTAGHRSACLLGRPRPFSACEDARSPVPPPAPFQLPDSGMPPLPLGRRPWPGDLLCHKCSLWPLPTPSPDYSLVGVGSPGFHPPT